MGRPWESNPITPIRVAYIDFVGNFIDPVYKPGDSYYSSDRYIPFGGKERVERLRLMLERFLSSGVLLRVLSVDYTNDQIASKLDSVDLLDVCGCIAGLDDHSFINAGLRRNFFSTS